MNARVNQKLYWARLVLGAALDSDGAAKTALLEAALFHLVTAYRCYLHEVLDDASGVALTSAQDVVQQRAQRGAESIPGLDELALLEHSGAWPQLMLTAYAAITASTEPQRNVGAGIALSDITTSADQDNCQYWLEQFQLLAQRQREHAREW